jgi:hypothetical protein
MGMLLTFCNDVLEANFLANSAGILHNCTPKRMGSDVGGPIIIPKVYKWRQDLLLFRLHWPKRRRLSAAEQCDITDACYEGGDFSDW